MPDDVTIPTDQDPYTAFESKDPGYAPFEPRSSGYGNETITSSTGETINQQFIKFQVNV